MRTQTFYELFFSSFIQFVLNFFQGEVHDVVMMQLFRRHQIAEAQPQAVHQVHFVRREVRRVRTEQEKFVAFGR